MLLKSNYFNTLTAAKMTALLAKIRVNAALKPSRLVVRKEGVVKTTIRGEDLVSFTIDETLATGTIVIDAGPNSGFGLQASLVVQDITYEAVDPGSQGNDITIEYVDDGTAGAETVDVTDTAIVVHIESGVSTATQVKAAIDGEPAALALVSATISGTAGDAQVTAAETPLAGGDDVQAFDKADVLKIRRLRAKKYMIVLKASANPAV